MKNEEIKEVLSCAQNEVGSWSDRDRAMAFGQAKGRSQKESNAKIYAIISNKDGEVISPKHVYSKIGYAKSGFHSLDKLRHRNVSIAEFIFSKSIDCKTLKEEYEKRKSKRDLARKIKTLQRLIVYCESRLGEDVKWKKELEEAQEELNNLKNENR